MSENHSVFFVNTLPQDDRREQADPMNALLQAIDESSCGVFGNTLVPFGHKRHDPWIISQFAMSRNSKFSPLIAVNPAYQHPVTVVKKLITLQTFYGNRVALNLITGSFTAEMLSVGDSLAFEARNDRLIEHLEVLCNLLDPWGKAEKKGKYLHVSDLEIFPKNQNGALDFFLSGALENEGYSSSPATYFVRSIRPIDQMSKTISPRYGLAVGVCARPTESEAKTAARELFPPDRKGEFLFMLSLANFQTPWNRWLKNYLDDGGGLDAKYFLTPMRTSRSSFPYIVGSYQNVAARLEEYRALGYGFFLVDYPPGEFLHISKCIELVQGRLSSQKQ